MSQFGRPIISKAGTARMGVESAKTRTIYLKVKPAPANLSERRAVLQMLKQHGDIHMFQRMIDPSSFISLPATKVIADRIVARSPLSFKYGGDGGSGHDSFNMETIADNKQQQQQKNKKKEFLIHVYATENFAHKEKIRDSPLHGRWDIDPLDVWGQHTLSTNALPQVVPPGMGYRGLCDWESCGQLNGEDDKVMLNDKEMFEVREKRRQTLATMESLIEIWKENTPAGRAAAEELERKGFVTTSKKTQAKQWQVLEKAAESKKQEKFGDPSF